MNYLAYCNSQLSIVDKILIGLKNPDWWQVIVSFLGVFATLLVAYIAIKGKSAFTKLLFDYEVSNIPQSINSKLEQKLRLKISNRGSRLADNVMVEVIKIEEYKNRQYVNRDDYIHMPLIWTHHGGNKYRKIAVHEDAYVDIGTKKLSKLELDTNPSVEDPQLKLVDIKSRITLRIIDESGFTENVVLLYEPNSSSKPLQINIKQSRNN